MNKNVSSHFWVTNGHSSSSSTSTISKTSIQNAIIITSIVKKDVLSPFDNHALPWSHLFVYRWLNFLLTNCYLYLPIVVIIVFFPKKMQFSRTPWSCGPIRHVLAGKVVNSNLATAKNLYQIKSTNISWWKSEQNIKGTLSLITSVKQATKHPLFQVFISIPISHNKWTFVVKLQYPHTSPTKLTFFIWAL